MCHACHTRVPLDPELEGGENMAAGPAAAVGNMEK